MRGSDRHVLTTDWGIDLAKRFMPAPEKVYLSEIFDGFEPDVQEAWKNSGIPEDILNETVGRSFEQNYAEIKANHPTWPPEKIGSNMKEDNLKGIRKTTPPGSAKSVEEAASAGLSEDAQGKFEKRISNKTTLEEIRADIEDLRKESTNASDKKWYERMGIDSKSMLNIIILLAMVGGPVAVALLVAAMAGSNGGTCSIKQFPLPNDKDRQLLQSLASDEGWAFTYDKTTMYAVLENNGDLDLLKAKLMTVGATGPDTSNNKSMWVFKQVNNPPINKVTQGNCSKTGYCTSDKRWYTIAKYPNTQADCNQIMKALSATSAVYSNNCCTVKGGVMTKGDCCGFYCRQTCKGSTKYECSNCYKHPSFWDKVTKTLTCMPPYGLFTGCWSTFLPKMAHYLLVGFSVVLGLVVITLVLYATGKAIHKHYEKGKLAGGADTDSIVALFRHALRS